MSPLLVIQLRKAQGQGLTNNTNTEKLRTEESPAIDPCHHREFTGRLKPGRAKNIDEQAVFRDSQAGELQSCTSATDLQRICIRKGMGLKFACRRLHVLTNCEQEAPNWVASREVTFGLSLIIGGENLSSPTGGSANGIPGT